MESRPRLKFFFLFSKKLNKKHSVSIVKCGYWPPCPWRSNYLWCRWRVGSGPGLCCVLSASCRDTRTTLVQTCLVSTWVKNRHNRTWAGGNPLTLYKLHPDSHCCMPSSAAWSSTAQTHSDTYSRKNSFLPAGLYKPGNATEMLPTRTTSCQLSFTQS